MSTTPDRPDHEDHTAHEAGSEHEDHAQHDPGETTPLETSPSDASQPDVSHAESPYPPPPPPPPAGGGYEGPPAGGYGQAPTAYGSSAATMAPLTPQEEKGWSLGAHLGVLLLGFLAPLLIWLIFKGRGPFLEHHAKESLNFQITVMIAMFVAVILTVLLIGIVFVLALVPWMIIMPIIAAVKANSGEWYRYPLTLRLIK